MSTMSVPQKLLLVFLLCVVFTASRDRSMLANYWDQIAVITADHYNYDPWIEGGPVIIRKQQQHPQSLHQHDPRRFASNTTLHVRRGLNVLRIQSSERIACWVYIGQGKRHPGHITTDLSDGSAIPETKFLRGPDMAPTLQSNDTLYVNPIYLQEFTKTFLPAIETDFVLLTDGWNIGYKRLMWMHEVSPTIVASPRLLKWFATDIHLNYTGGMEFHPKVAPFPLGLKQNIPGAKVGHRRRPVNIYQAMFNATLHNPALLEKTTPVFAGFIRVQNNKNRAQLPNGPILDYNQYLNKLASARAVISPDGDHPDCHRHYESIGMGAIPITQLDPFLYRHMKEVEPGIIFNNTNWNMTDLRSMFSASSTHAAVNRNYVFEESWMEYVERTVGRPLRWWDVVGLQQSLMDDFVVP